VGTSSASASSSRAAAWRDELRRSAALEPPAALEVAAEAGLVPVTSALGVSAKPPPDHRSASAEVALRQRAQM
jgi:hypothetical protein